MSHAGGGVNGAAAFTLRIASASSAGFPDDALWTAPPSVPSSAMSSSMRVFGTSAPGWCVTGFPAADGFQFASIACLTAA